MNHTLTSKTTFLRTLWILVILLWQLNPVSGQKRKDDNRSSDLTDTAISAQIKSLQSRHHADSVKLAGLMRQIDLLTTEHNISQEELQRRIKEMNSADSLRRAALIREVDSLRKISPGYPVIPFGTDTIFQIYCNVGSFTPPERANAISQRISALLDEFPFKADSLRTETVAGLTEISYKGKSIMSISERDALWMHTDQMTMAKDYRQRIIDTVKLHQQQTSIQAILGKIGIALLVVFITVLIIRLISWFFRWITRKTETASKKWIRVIRIREYELLTVERQLMIITFILNIFKWINILIIIYFTFPILFNIFPRTKRFADLLIGYIVNPLKSILEALWNYIPNLITILVIATVFHYVLKGIRFLRDEVAREALRIPGFYADLANPTYQIIRVLILAFMLVVIFPYLPGADSPVFKGVSVFLGVLFTFGSSGSLSNLISGLVITFMRSFRSGDRVKIGEVTGDIIEKSMLVTRIRTIKNEIISIPNSTVLSSHLINYSSEAGNNGLILHTTVTIGYDAPWRTVHKLLIDAALVTPGIEKEPAPFVLQTSLDDFFVSYQINAYTRRANDQAVIYAQLHANIQDKFNEGGVEIMSPHYRSFRNGNETTIPSSYRSKE